MPFNDMKSTLERLQSENRRLRISVEELAILNEIATAISSTLSLDRIVDLIINKCVKHLKVEQAAVLLLEEESSDQPFRTMVRKADTVSKYLPYRLDTQLTGWMIRNQKPLVINDLKSDPRIQTADDSDATFSSLLAAPLIQKNRMIGLLSVFNKKDPKGFTDDDQRLLTIISSQSAQVIENARLYKEEQALLRIQEEMRLASQIQTKLLPKKAPEIDGYDIAGMSIAAADVGGDYFDFIPFDENRQAICLADVSGKGMPAALLMSNLQATLRTQSMMGIPTAECVHRTNHLLFHITDTDKYATLFYGVLDSKNHCLCYTNAGHDNPYLFRKDGSVRRLSRGGIVVGFMEKYAYSEEKISLKDGDLLLIYTDGITEALTTGEEEFGEERLEKIVRANMNEKADVIIDLIIKDILTFRGTAPQTDDMTLMIIKQLR